MLSRVAVTITVQVPERFRGTRCSFGATTRVNSPAITSKPIARLAGCRVGAGGQVRSGFADEKHMYASLAVAPTGVFALVIPAVAVSALLFLTVASLAWKLAVEVRKLLEMRSLPGDDLPRAARASKAEASGDDLDSSTPKGTTIGDSAWVADDAAEDDASAASTDASSDERTNNDHVTSGSSASRDSVGSSRSGSGSGRRSPYITSASDIATSSLAPQPPWRDLSG